MKFLIIFFIISDLFAGGGGPPQPDRCESSTFCVNAKMPLFDQSNYQLLEYISKKTGRNISYDQGYCAPTATAMWLAGLKLDAPKVKFNNLLDGLTDLNVQSKAPELIWDVGQGMGTNWKSGGAHPLRILWYARSQNNGVKNYTRKNSEDSWEGLHAGTQAGGFKGDIKKHKMSILILLGTFKGVGHKLTSVDCSKNPCNIQYKRGSSYWRTGGHVMVINGYEGDYFKVHDPWGRIYNIRIDRQFILFGHRAFIWSINGAYGFVSSAGMDLSKSNNAVLLDGFYEIGLKD
jgi:hypothetical protein